MSREQGVRRLNVGRDLSAERLQRRKRSIVTDFLQQVNLDRTTVEFAIGDIEEEELASVGGIVERGPAPEIQQSARAEPGPESVDRVDAVRGEQDVGIEAEVRGRESKCRSEAVSVHDGPDKERRTSQARPCRRQVRVFQSVANPRAGDRLIFDGHRRDADHVQIEISSDRTKGFDIA